MMNFNDIFDKAIQAGLAVAKSGGKVAENWLKKIAAANEHTIEAIANGVAKGDISDETAVMLWQENENTLRSEADALSVVIRAAAQGAINAFLGSLRQGLGAALKIAI